jgi:hypothetical protein
LAFLLGALQLLQVSRINFSVMEHRMWFEIPFDIGLNLEWPVILLAAICIALLAMRRSLFTSLPLVSIVSYTVWGLNVAVPVVALAASLGGLLELRKWEGFAFTVLGALSAVELGAVIHWLLYATIGNTAPLSEVAHLEETIFYLLTPASLMAMAAIAVLCLVLPLRLLFVSGVKQAQGLAGIIKGPAQREIATEKTMGKRSRRTTYLLLALIGYAAFSALYPSLPGVNPNRVDLGVDISAYVSDLEKIAADYSYILKAEGGSRPIFFVFLTLFQRIFGFSSFDAITYSPIVIAPILALSAYFLTREVLRDDGYALWASFFTITGFHLVIGMYSYFLTNMLGLSIAFAMLTFVFRFYRKPRLLEGLAAALLAVMLLFTHPWTFDQYVAALAPVVLYAAVKGETREVRLLSRVGLVLSITLIGGAELLKGQVLGGLGGLGSLDTLFRGFTSLDNLAPSFYESVFYYNGLLANFVLLVIVAVGVYAWRRKGPEGIYFTTLLLASTVAFLLVDAETKKRLIYNYPFGILASVGLMRLRQVKGKELKTVATFFTAVALIAYQLRSLANLV